MRLTIRRLMLAIAVFAVAMFIGQSYHRSGEYRREAKFYAGVAKRGQILAELVEAGEVRLEGYTAEESRRAVIQARRLADHARRMESKYEFAVYLPWLPMAPDPPRPTR